MKPNRPISEIKVQKLTTTKSQPHQTIITTIQQSKPNNKTQKVQLLPTDLIANNIINDILFIANKKIQQNKLVNTLSNDFSTKFTQLYLNQNIDMHLSLKISENTINQQSQPNTIKNDNLCPVSTMVQEKIKDNDQVNSLPASINQTIGRITRNMSTLSKVSRNPSQNLQTNNNNKKTPKVYEFIKIPQKNLPKTQITEVNDPLINELRRLKQQKTKQKFQQPKQQEKKPTLRQRIKLSEKISYDYTGNLLKIKQSQQKSTLLTAQIKSIQHQGRINRPFESLIQKNPTSLENPILKKDKTKKIPSNRQPEVEFSNVTSLTPHLQIKDGAKFIHNKATMQKKKKQRSLNDIKKSLSLNRISRQQFGRLKSIDNDNPNKRLPFKGSISPSLPSLHKDKNISQSISYQEESNNNISSIRHNTNIYSSINSDRMQIRSLPKYTQIKKNHKLLMTQRSCQRISVENQQLSEILFDQRFDIKVNDESIVKKNEDNQKDKQNSHLQALSPRDIANLHYIKTGGTIGKLQLPKITFRLPEGHHKQKLQNSIIQSKTKIKGKRNQNQFQRLKKHFQQKLRV